MRLMPRKPFQEYDWNYNKIEKGAVSVKWRGEVREPGMRNDVGRLRVASDDPLEDLPLCAICA